MLVKSRHTIFSLTCPSPFIRLNIDFGIAVVEAPYESSKDKREGVALAD
jgi:hypothetical protein